MSSYLIPKLTELPHPNPNEVLLVASGDLRQSANQACWPAQAEMETQVSAAFAGEGIRIKRAHPYDPRLGHGFIWNQRMGMDVFADIHPDAKVIVAEAVWQYSHHVLAGLRSHRGPILTCANWSGQWPGLVGMLNLNGCLTKAGVSYSTLWSEDFKDEFFLKGIRQWLKDGKVTHDARHVKEIDVRALPSGEVELGRALARQLRRQKAILGVFDEGCMGMYNAIIEDEFLNPLGVYKERLSQAALVAAMREVSNQEAQAVRDWLDRNGVTFVTGPDPETDLTDSQILEQCKMYIAAVRMAHEFGCDAIGIQYQQGLKDMTPASDLVEGLLNNVVRPPVYDSSGQELFAGRAVPHFNEVDECCGLDALVTNRLWTAMGMDPATTLHDVRWGDWYRSNGKSEYIWVLLISGAAPASHFVGGYRGASSERQPPMYFRLGGGTLKGISKPGEVIWSRIYIEGGALQADIGRAKAVQLPQTETERRWKATTSQWPIMHAVLSGITRDQFMGRQKANHVNVVYIDTPEMSEKALAAKAAMLMEMGVKVFRCGN